MSRIAGYHLDGVWGITWQTGLCQMLTVSMLCHDIVWQATYSHVVQQKLFWYTAASPVWSGYCHILTLLLLYSCYIYATAEQNTTGLNKEQKLGFRASKSQSRAWEASVAPTTQTDWHNTESYKCFKLLKYICSQVHVLVWSTSETRRSKLCVWFCSC